MTNQNMTTMPNTHHNNLYVWLITHTYYFVNTHNQTWFDETHHTHVHHSLIISNTVVLTFILTYTTHHIIHFTHYLQTYIYMCNTYYTCTHYNTTHFICMNHAQFPKLLHQPNQTNTHTDNTNQYLHHHSTTVV